MAAFLSESETFGDLIGNKNFILGGGGIATFVRGSWRKTLRDATLPRRKHGGEPLFPTPASFILTFEQLFPTKRASGAAARSSGCCLLLPRSAEPMRREEEPRKADCRGCHGDFIPKAAKHGSFEERHSQMSQEEGNGEKKARVNP